MKNIHGEFSPDGTEFVIYDPGTPHAFDNGLIIDPCIPSDWKESCVLRRYRRIDHRIYIHNPDGLQHSNLEITVEGQSIEGKLISIHNDGEPHDLEILKAKGDNP